MNIFNIRRIRPLLWSVSALFLLSAGAAQARPNDPPWLVPPAITPASTPTCGKVWREAGYGPGNGPKAIHIVARDLGPCPHDRTVEPVTRYSGPRNTIPVRQ